VTRIREAEALPGWLRTTIRHECLMLLRNRNRRIPTDSTLIDCVVEPEFDAALIAAERSAAARAAFARLPARDRELLSMLFAEPPRASRSARSARPEPIASHGPAAHPRSRGLMAEHRGSPGHQRTRTSPAHSQLDPPSATSA